MSVAQKRSIVYDTTKFGEKLKLHPTNSLSVGLVTAPEMFANRGKTRAEKIREGAGAVTVDITIV
jgi:hypothetical protein